MKITGIVPLRNGTKLGYPYELAIRSLRLLCDEVIVGVDPSSEDDTLARVQALPVDRIIEPVWNMNNHQGHTNCEISIQTQKLCNAASGDWVFSLQADEVLHEDEVPRIRASVERAASSDITGIEMLRYYFYGSLAQIREDWTLWMVRLFKRGCWKPDVDGAMRFDPIGKQAFARTWTGHIWHYSRMGDPQMVAERVRNLDRFFHQPEQVQAGEIAPYDFDTARKQDTYVIGHEDEAAFHGVLLPFDVALHPAGARALFHE